MFFRPTEDTDKTIRLGDSQMDVFTSGIGLTSGYVTIAPYGGGKYMTFTYFWFTYNVKIFCINYYC